MKNTHTTINILPGDLTVVAGPSYEVSTEDGPIDRFDWHVVYRDRKPEALTLRLSFQNEREAEEARGAIEDGGIINVDNWNEKDPWYPYHQGMTLQERWAPHGETWRQEQKDAGRGF